MTNFEPTESEQVQFIESHELEQWLEQEDAPLMIDVREKGQATGATLGGLNIPLTEFASSLNQLDPDKAVVIYCQLGQKSFNAASLLIQADFTSVYSLKGGLEAWKRK